jgi:hypothetical protein
MPLRLNALNGRLRGKQFSTGKNEWEAPPFALTRAPLPATDDQLWMVYTSSFHLPAMKPLTIVSVATMPSVDVATVGKTASALVLLICLLALTVGLFTGFYFIYPPIAAGVAVLACVFYAMSLVLERQWQRQ